MRAIRHTVICSAVLVAFGLGASSAAADTLTFDTQITAGTVECPGGAFAADCSFSEGDFLFDGFGFNGTTPHVGDGGVGGDQTINWHSGSGLNGGPPTGFVMTKTGGVAFNLVSLDVFVNVEGGVFNIAADFGSGFINQGDFGTGLQTLNLTNVIAVRFSETSNNSGVGFDNIATDATTVVPEPASLTLLGLGLAGLGARRRRLRQTT